MKYYADPFGCAKNNVDLENMMASLNEAGWTSAADSSDASLIIINSCGFIESAKQESINAVLGWRKLYPGKKILLAGCLAERYAKDLAESLPEADGIFGNSGDLRRIVEAAAHVTGEKPHTKERAPTEPSYDTGDRPLLSLPGLAYVKISEGCDCACSFCAIPLIRGKMRSRSIEDIITECTKLLDRGVKELCLISQDTGAYGRDLRRSSENSNEINLPTLLQAIAKLEGDFQVRMLYLHPDHFPMQVLDIMERDRRFLPYFDIPLQHGSEKILRMMNRSGNSSVYLEFIKTLRSRFPDGAVRSTFMTGFPGETEDDFQQLLDFQNEAKLDWVGCFAYSREEDTKSYDMKGRVAKKTAAARKQLLEERQLPITEARMERFVGRTFNVLIEEAFKNEEGAAIPGDDSLYLGRLPFQAPEVDGSAVITSTKPLTAGMLVPCKVFARTGFDLQVRAV